MGSVAHVILELEDGQFINPIEDELEFQQNYDAFAILTGCRNYNNVKPIIEESGDFTEAQKKGLDDYELYPIYSHFTLTQFDSFDLDKSLEFLPGIPDSKNPEMFLSHRWESIQPNDTYRSHIERETGIFKWIGAIKLYEPKVVTIFLSFD